MDRRPNTSSKKMYGGKIGGTARSCRRKRGSNKREKKWESNGEVTQQPGQSGNWVFLDWLKNKNKAYGITEN